MVAKINAIYLGANFYEKTKEDGETIGVSCFQFLVFDFEKTDYLVNPRIMNFIRDEKSEETAEMYRSVPNVLERCVLDCDVYINPRSAVAQIRIVSCEA